MATNGKRNRTAGHNWERRCAKRYVEAGFTYVVTSRSESRSRDDQKIDLINKNEAMVGRLFSDNQCKSVAGRVPYEQLLGEIKGTAGTIPVLLHNFTKKSKPDKGGNEKFETIGNFAILYFDDFFKLVEDLKKYWDLKQEL